MATEQQGLDDIDPWAPRRNPDLVGHEGVLSALVQAAQGGRLPHAVLVGGRAGIGKATLAFRFARWLLAETPEAAPGLFDLKPGGRLCHLDPDHPTFRRVSASSHADLLTIERGYDPKRKKMRGEIVVDDTRAVAQFLRHTAGEGGWRVVIVDSADDMNRNAANALLKILEEPPPRALLLLICHAPGRLLPTIRSRCRSFLLHPLAEADVIRLLAQHRPALGTVERDALARLADGSIGTALMLADTGGLDLYRGIITLLGTLPRTDGALVHQVGDQLARADGDAAWDSFTDLLLDALGRMVAGAASGTSRAVLAEERAIFDRLAASLPLDRWIALIDGLRTLYGRGDAVNLDRKQMLLETVGMIEGALGR